MGRIAGIFDIGETGEEFVVAEWVPDPEVIANQLFKLANDLEDWTEPLTEAKEAFIYSTELHFETQSDPYGREWAALDDAYLKRKLAAGWPEDILTRSGALRKAATSQDAWQITERDIIFRSEVLPFNEGTNYGAVHQAGTAESEASILHNTALDKLFGGRELSSEETAAINKGRSGLNLPQRMFIGADEDTIAEIEEIFGRWINRTVQKDFGGIVKSRATTTTGLTGILTGIPSGGGFMVRGAGGRFIGRTS